MRFQPSNRASLDNRKRLRLDWLYPVLADSEPDQEFKGGICAPADLPLRKSSFPSGMRDLPRPLSADGVGFETIRYYLTINTIKDLYCDVTR